MKIVEVAGMKKIPHLYLDMDGVQADFFGAWADSHGVSHWKAIHDRENDIQELANSSAQEVYDFFYKLKPLKGGMQIVAWLQQNKIPYTILSAPLRGPYSDASVQAKIDWLNKYLPGTSGNAIFTSAKYKYALSNGEPNVLVDDYGLNLQKWSDAGGIAVKHEDEFEVPDTGAETIKKLEQIYFPKGEDTL